MMRSCQIYHTKHGGQGHGNSLCPCRIFMKHLTLFQLRDEIAELVDEIVDAEIAGDTELVNALLAELANLYEAREAKHEGYVHVIKNAEAAADACYKEANAFYTRNKALKGLATRLKDILMYELKADDARSITAGTFKVARQRNSQPSVIMNIEAEALPTEFQRITIEADKEVIKDALSNGTEIDGVSLVTGEHIRIRVK